MKHCLYILGIGLGLSGSLFANQNVNNGDLNETNAIQGEEQVLELDEFNADYALFEGISLESIGKGLTDFAASVKEKLGSVVSSIADKLGLCPQLDDKVKEKLKNITGTIAQMWNKEPTQAEMTDIMSEYKKDIQKAICPSTGQQIVELPGEVWDKIKKLKK